MDAAAARPISHHRAQQRFPIEELVITGPSGRPCGRLRRRPVPPIAKFGNRPKSLGRRFPLIIVGSPSNSMQCRQLGLSPKCGLNQASSGVANLAGFDLAGASIVAVVSVFLVVTFDEIDQLVGFAPPAGFPRPVIVAWSGSHCRPLQPTRAVGSVRRRHGAGSHRHPDVSCSWAVLPPPRAAKSPVP